MLVTGYQQNLVKHYRIIMLLLLLLMWITLIIRQSTQQSNEVQQQQLILDKEINVQQSVTHESLNDGGFSHWVSFDHSRLFIDSNEYNVWDVNINFGNESGLFFLFWICFCVAIGLILCFSLCLYCT